MDKSFMEKIAFEVVVILAALAMFCLILRLWPLVFLVIPAILIAALRLLFLSVKKNTDEPVPAAAPPEPPHPDTEQDVIRTAFGILQHRVTEHVTSRYPAARWIWEAPDPMERFAGGLPLNIILNQAGGYQKAAVQIHCLQFRGLAYESAETGVPDEPPEDGADSTPGHEDRAQAEDIDYALIAYQWTESNLLDLNNRCNDAIAGGLTSLLIPAGELPHPGSWAGICDELTRNGFAGAVIEEDGISVPLPQ